MQLSETTHPLSDPSLPGGFHGYGWNPKLKRFDEYCGYSGTIPGFSSDAYYLHEEGIALTISVTRLDRDDKSQTTPVLVSVLKAFSAPRKP